MLAGALLLATALAAPELRPGFNYYSWERVLKKHVKPGAIMGIHTNVVDYQKIAKDPDFWETVRSLGEVDLTTISVNESFAIGCNAYNVYSIKMIIDNACAYSADGTCLGPVYGLPGIKANPYSDKPFDTNNIGGINFTYGQIEDMLRPIPKAPLFREDVLPIQEDLRVHACMVCDGISCPDVRMYYPETIEEDLDSAARNWMANPFKGLRINTMNNTIFWSRIMIWFKEEFDAQGGVVKAYGKFLPKEVTDWLAANPVFSEDYMGYVWDANGPVPCACDGYNATSPEVQHQPHAHIGWAGGSSKNKTREDCWQEVVEPDLPEEFQPGYIQPPARS